jgi:hypothetical protein
MQTETKANPANLLSFPKSIKTRKNPVRRSSWIAEVKYHNGFLVCFTKQGTAFIFSDVPAHVVGLVLAGTGGKSVGHAFHKIMKDQETKEWKYPHQYVKDQKEVQELREMMK